jgi:hypothetical protein
MTKAIVVAVFALAISTMNGASRITYVDLPGSGIQMVPGSSDEFASTLTAFAGSSALSLLQPILPYSIIVRNDSTSALRLVIVRLNLKKPSGDSTWHEATLIERIAPGEMALITPVGGLNTNLRARLQSPALRDTDDLTALLRKRALEYIAMPEVEVTLDSVVFDDGGVIGPDNIHNLQRMNSWRDADQYVVTELKKRSSEERITFLQQILALPQKPAGRPEEIDQFQFRQRSTAELMTYFLKAFSSELEVLTGLDDYLQSQVPHLYRRDK